MSRTPETIRDKGAERIKTLVIGAGLFCGLVSFGGFSNGDPGIGLVFGGIGFGLVWAGTKIKTVFHKKAEGGIYEK